MKVWELMAKLGRCNANADVQVGIPEFYDQPAERFEYYPGSDDEADDDCGVVAINGCSAPDPSDSDKWRALS